MSTIMERASSIVAERNAAILGVPANGPRAAGYVPDALASMRQLALGTGIDPVELDAILRMFTHETMGCIVSGVAPAADTIYGFLATMLMVGYHHRDLELDERQAEAA